MFIIKKHFLRLLLVVLCFGFNFVVVNQVFGAVNPIPTSPFAEPTWTQVVTPTPGGCSCNQTDECKNMGGTCGSPSRSGDSWSGLCPCGSGCKCVNVTGHCYALNGDCASYGGSCGAPNRAGTKITGLCSGGSECVCIVPACVPNCNESGSYCTGTPYGGNCGQTCYGTIPAVNGISGSCGGSNGGNFVSPPGDLCASGNLVWTDNGGTDGTYDWYCAGTAGTCGGATGSTAYCGAIRDFAPTLSSLVLRTYEGNSIVAAESGNRNQICQSAFKTSTNPNGIRFVVTGADVQGVADISSIQVRLRGNNTYTFAAVAASGGVVTIPVDLAVSGVASGTYNIDVLVNDWHYSLNSGWVDTGRDFKYWDCKVSVSGGFYDGSAGQICPNFSSALATDANFKSLTFTSPGSGLSSVMTVNSNPTYNDGGNKLTWGAATYVASLNADLAATDLSLRLIDLGIGTTRTCSSTLSFTLDNNMVDPYAATPNLRADFSATVDQDSWFQAINSGILSKSLVKNYVPTTCRAPTCTPAMSINGLVSAPVINNTSDIPHSSPNNWWYSSSSLISQINYYEKFKSLGIGETINGDLNDLIDKDGLVLVNGNINISQDKTVGVGGFLMLIASGDITIAPEVTKVEGVLVGRNINIGGTNSNQLVINGSLYGTDEVRISRSYTNKRINNASPAVKVNLRPDFIFKIPSEISNKVTNWKWGN